MGEKLHSYQATAIFLRLSGHVLLKYHFYLAKTHLWRVSLIQKYKNLMPKNICQQKFAKYDTKIHNIEILDKPIEE